jgi:23S rRNA pseudouridine1911/1915/1917 synthase
MPYIDVEYTEEKPKKAFLSLMHQFSISQREAQRWIAFGRLSGVKNSGQPVSGTLKVKIFRPEPHGAEVIYENSSFAILNKPSGVPVHQLNQIDYSFSDEVKGLFGMEANVTHRLDQDTSGAVLVAKSRSADRELKMLFQNREIEKSYLAVVWGELRENRVIKESLLEIRKPRKLGKGFYSYTVADSSGKSAETEIEVLKNFGNKTLLRAFPKSGRRHQIRVHLESIGFPIVGDPVYGTSDEIRELYWGKKLSVEDRKERLQSSRLLLHSEGLSFKFRGSSYSFRVGAGWSNI